MQCGLLILGDHLADPTSGARGPAAARHRQFVELGVAVRDSLERFGSEVLPRVQSGRP